MKESIKLGIISIVAILLISSAYIIYSYDEEAETVENDIVFNSAEGVIFNPLCSTDNTKIEIMGRNNTLLFFGDYTNETLMNTSLTLNMTLKEFIYLIMPSFYNNTFQYEVFEQVAKQLNEADE